jgi:hypothetical protein
MIAEFQLVFLHNFVSCFHSFLASYSAFQSNTQSVSSLNFTSGQLGRSGGAESPMSKHILFAASPTGLRRLNRGYTHLIAVIGSRSEEIHTSGEILHGGGPCRPIKIFLNHSTGRSEMAHAVKNPSFPRPCPSRARVGNPKISCSLQ